MLQRAITYSGLCLVSFGLLLGACANTNDELSLSDANLEDSATVSAALENGATAISTKDEAVAFSDSTIDTLIDQPQPSSSYDAYNATVQLCGGGVMRGHFKRFAKHELGIFRGVIKNRDAEGYSYIKGIFGLNSFDRHVVYAKVIDREGKFMARLHGTYGNEHFRLKGYDAVNKKVGYLRGTYGGAYDEKGSKALTGHWRVFCVEADDDMTETELNAE